MNIRQSTTSRTTKETSVSGSILLEGNGVSELAIPIGFLSHMIEQLCFHSGCNLTLKAQGDVWRDDHHVIEDVALVLGTLVREALGDRTGIERYGQSILPMDDVLCLAAVDLVQRPFFQTDYSPVREMVNDFSTEMLWHFLNTFANEARINLQIKMLNPGRNEHHRIEAIFKAIGRAMKMAWQVTTSKTPPSTKGTL
ncbi:imidazoleglycerol-phosphate dehydratase [Candidatus Gracilibacteria bacterium]|nr:imidazoleglycerol-phosphate dehydratase [Candidatus Gracilibacteria bacterium]